jgi:hypothetical protein
MLFEDSYIHTTLISAAKDGKMIVNAEYVSILVEGYTWITVD